MTSGETFAAQAGEALFGATGGRVFAAVVVLSIFGSLVGLLMVAPRGYLAMARDGLVAGNPVRALAGLGVAVLGIPVYELAFRRR